jgi:hypothetical protein
MLFVACLCAIPSPGSQKRQVYVRIAATGRRWRDRHRRRVGELGDQLLKLERCVVTWRSVALRRLATRCVAMVKENKKSSS